MRRTRGAALQHPGQAVAIEDVVAQDQAHRVGSDEFPADDERLGQAVGRFLHRVLQVDTPLAAVAKQVDEVTGLSTLVVIDAKRRGAAKVVRPQVKLLDVAGNEVKIPGTDHSVTIGFPIGALSKPRRWICIRSEIARRNCAKSSRAP